MVQRRKQPQHLSKPELSRARMERVMDFMRRYELEYGRAPTAREICDGVGIPSTSVVKDYLFKLEKQGRVSLETGIARGITIRDWGDIRVATGQVCKIPIIGHIVAGHPLPIPDGVKLDGDHVVVPRSRLPRNNLQSIYALVVKGDSMIDALIAEDDIVILKYQQQAQYRDMVVARVKDEDGFTLKYFYPKGRTRVLLQPANPKYKTIEKRVEDVEIQGKVILVLRQYEHSE